MKPVRLPASATLALPRWGLFALSLLYILPGLFGRDPWKNEDAGGFGIMWTMAHGTWTDWVWPHIAGLPVNAEGPLAFWVGALCIKLFGWALGDASAARIATVLFFLLGTFSVWYAAFLLGKRSEAQPLRLAFGGQPEPRDYGRTLADSAVLIYIACFGLLLPSHETTAEALQVSLVAFLLYRAACYVEAPSLRNALTIGGALGAMLLTRGWSAPLLLWFSLFLGVRLYDLPQRRAALHLLGAGALAVGVLLAWLLLADQVRPFGPQAMIEWAAWNLAQTGAPTMANFRFLVRDGLWFCWPALPIACWSVYAWRRQRRALHIVLPVAFFLVLVLLAVVNPHLDTSVLLPLLPPLAVLGAFGLPTMKRGAINAIDWFSVMVLTTGAAYFWLAWSATLTGWPAQQRRNVLKLIPGYQPEFHWFAVLVALLATVAWFLLVHWRVSRRPSVLWRAVVLSSGGVTLCWVLLMTLFLAPIDYSKSYALVAGQIKAKLPADAQCVESNASQAQRASFAYFAGLPFARPEQRCGYLLLQDSMRIRDEIELPAAYRGPQWQLLWEGRRPGDKVERLRLYRRVAQK
jgi:4-amino-4-deoxy-L-arabinose transferase-like glycosyltransferase